MMAKMIQVRGISKAGIFSHQTPEQYIGAWRSVNDTQVQLGGARRPAQTSKL